ncbi:RNA polymerase sigma factor [Embleya sp. NPDC050154]|uniref:RNA polymerase sigma factor n=1 Tax=unclassified Embleya TaxID=2699296 RepID=UPI0033C296B2
MADEAELDEGTLVVRAQEGDAEAFEVLMRRHGRSLYTLALRILGRPTDAEDAVQEAFISAWRRLPGFRAESSFLTWMYRIVTNRALNIARTRRPTVGLDQVPDRAIEQMADNPERRAEGSAALKALQEAMTTLTEEQRACWVLRELHGQSYDEIAAAVGIGANAVRGRIFRARQTLAEAMRPWT